MQIKDLNINALFNLTSAAVVVFGYLWASLANNKRMDDFRQSMDFLRDQLLAEIRAASNRLEGKIDLLANRIDGVERRLDRIEGQLEHPVVRP